MAIATVAVIGIVAAVALTRQSTDEVSTATVGNTPTPSSSSTAPGTPRPAEFTPVTTEVARGWIEAGGKLEGLEPEGSSGVKIITNPGDQSIRFDQPLLEPHRFQALATDTFTRTAARPANPDLSAGSSNYSAKVYILATPDDATGFLTDYKQRALGKGFSQSATYGTGGVVLQSPTNVDLLFQVRNSIVRINMGVNPGTPTISAAKDATDMADLEVAAGAKT